VSGKGTAIGVVVALVAAGAAYGAGRFQGRAEVRDAEARASAAASGSASAVALAGVTADIERGKVARLEARRRLHLAMIALDEKNFGIANDHVVAARGHLVAAKGSDNEVGKLATELEAMKIAAADDVTEPRNKLLGWIKRIDDLMPPSKP
jgi:hypothetical protein